MRTELICILDGSGSMSHLVDDTIGGYNNFIEDQKKIPDPCRVTTIVFDSIVKVVRESDDLQTTNPLTSKDYCPGGMTALYDAIGYAISSSGTKYSQMSAADKPEKVIVLIITDGAENSSQQYNGAKIKEMIKHQEDKYNWSFVYLGANQDSFASAVAGLGLNVSNVSNYTASVAGTSTAYTSFMIKVASLRSGQSDSAVDLTQVVNSAS